MASIQSMSFAVSLLCAISSAYAWQKGAVATFFGENNGKGLDGGACGYKGRYGSDIAALGFDLYDDGLGCGACFEIKCDNEPRWCLSGSVKVTATDRCCPGLHFDLSQPLFRKIAKKEGGKVPVLYRRVPCARRGGIRFTLNGNPYALLILVSNVGGGGDVKAVSIKGSSKGSAWQPMRRNWGQNWEIKNIKLNGQALSFMITTRDGRSVTAVNAIPANRQFGRTYEARGVQF